MRTWGIGGAPFSVVLDAIVSADHLSSASLVVTDYWMAVPSGVTLTSGSGQIPVLTIPACDDGLDNDGDGLVDYAESGGDPACQMPASPLENPKCDDDLDNDGDGKIDWDGGVGAGVIDPQCTGLPWKNKEAAGGCGIGAELALALPLLGLLLRRARGSAASQQRRGA